MSNIACSGSSGGLGCAACLMLWIDPTGVWLVVVDASWARTSTDPLAVDTITCWLTSTSMLYMIHVLPHTGFYKHCSSARPSSPVRIIPTTNLFCQLQNCRFSQSGEDADPRGLPVHRSRTGRAGFRQKWCPRSVNKCPENPRKTEP